jgi:hypothetical protein
MALAKDKSLVLSLDNFSKFTKMTKDIIDDYYYNNSIFIVCYIKSDRLVLLHTFNGRKQHKKGQIMHSYIWDNKIVQSIVKIYKDESKNDYNENMLNFYPYLIKEVELGRLYAIKI